MAEQFTEIEHSCVYELLVSLQKRGHNTIPTNTDMDATEILINILPLIRARLLNELADEIWARAPELTGKEISASMRSAAEVIIDNMPSTYIHPTSSDGSPRTPNLRLVPDE